MQTRQKRAGGARFPKRCAAYLPGKAPGGASEHSQGWRARSARNPWGRDPVFQSPARAEGPWPGVEGAPKARTQPLRARPRGPAMAVVAGGGGCGRASALPPPPPPAMASLSGRQPVFGALPGVPLAASRLAPPLAMLRRPLAGASLGRNAALLHGGRALPDFTKSPCFPKWRFYRPSLGTLESSIRQSPAFLGNRANPEKPEEPEEPEDPEDPEEPEKPDACSPYGAAIGEPRFWIFWIFHIFRISWGPHWRGPTGDGKSQLKSCGKLLQKSHEVLHYAKITWLPERAAEYHQPRSATQLK